MRTGTARLRSGARILAPALVLSAAIAVLSAHDPIKTRVTWTGDISRIVEARCASCHGANARGTMSLATYEDARPWATAIKEEVMTRRMPKWHAVRGYGDFSNDPSLSPFEIALVTAWVDGGAPRGTAADAGRAAPALGPPALAQPLAGREVTVACGEQPAPEGTLLAVRPMLEKDGAVGIAMTFPGGEREIVAWIRGFEPELPATYRLRVPLVLPANTIVSALPATAGCRIALTLLTP